MNLNNKLNENFICYKEGENFIIEKTKKINFVFISKNQTISIGTSLIPFLKHDDANRALMGSNMQRQALPLKEQEASLLETGPETQIIKTSQFSTIAKKSGLIKYISCKKIIIKSFIEKWNFKENLSTFKKYKKIVKKNFLSKKKYTIKNYKIETARKSNQNSYIKQVSIYHNKKWVKKGQIITNGLGIYKGKLSLGKTIFIAYMGWEGYNFEDAIVINKNLVDNNIFTSLHMKKYKIFLLKNNREEV